MPPDSPRPRRTLLAALLMLGGGCRAPQPARTSTVARADSALGQGRLREAAIEYQNQLQQEPGDARTSAKLGVVYADLGELDKALPLLAEACRHEPGDARLRFRLASTYAAAGRLDLALEEAKCAAGLQPDHLGALLLLAELARSPGEVDDALRLLEEQRPAHAHLAGYLVAIGSLQAKRFDLSAAERSFREAIAADPRSAEAREALGSVHLLRREFPEAERAFAEAVAVSPARIAARVKLAESYLFARRPDQAKRVLTDLVRQAPDAAAARRLLAALAFDEGDLATCAVELSELLALAPGDPTGLQLRGQVHLANLEIEAALADFRAVVDSAPRFAPGHHGLARALAAAGQLDPARQAAREAVRLVPDYLPARYLVAELALRTGAPREAIADLEELVAERQDLSGAYGLLGAAYLQDGVPARASEAYRRYAALLPGEPRGRLLLGRSLAAEGQLAPASEQFEAALAERPDLVEALAELVAIHRLAGHPEAAVLRVERQAALAPGSARVQFLLATLYQEARSLDLAEAAYLRSIELDPHPSGAYLRLGQIYAQSRRFQSALDRFTQVLAQQPGNLGVRMLKAQIHQMMGASAEAIREYEKILELNPRFAEAANNLAWLYSEEPGEGKKALALAEKARAALPDDPYVADTYGWILYRQGQYRPALAQFLMSSAKLADNPDVQLHLGLAYHKLGDRENARGALGRALQMQPPPAGAEEARRILAEMK